MSRLILVSSAEDSEGSASAAAEAQLSSRELWRARQIGLRLSNLAIALAYVSEDHRARTVLDTILLAQENRTRVKIETKAGLTIPPGVSDEDTVAIRERVANHHEQSGLFILRAYGSDSNANLLTVAAPAIIEAYAEELGTIAGETTLSEEAVSAIIRAYAFAEDGRIINRELYAIRNGVN